MAGRIILTYPLATNKRMKVDKDYIKVRVSDLRKLRVSVDRHGYVQTEQEKKESGAALLGFIDGWLSGLDV